MKFLVQDKAFYHSFGVGEGVVILSSRAWGARDIRTIKRWPALECASHCCWRSCCGWRYSCSRTDACPYSPTRTASSQKGPSFTDYRFFLSLFCGNQPAARFSAQCGDGQSWIYPLRIDVTDQCLSELFADLWAFRFPGLGGARLGNGDANGPNHRAGHRVNVSQTSGSQNPVRAAGLPPF